MTVKTENYSNTKGATSSFTTGETSETVVFTATVTVPATEVWYVEKVRSVMLNGELTNANDLLHVYGRVSVEDPLLGLQFDFYESDAQMGGNGPANATAEAVIGRYVSDATLTYTCVRKKDNSNSTGDIEDLGMMVEARRIL